MAELVLSLDGRHLVIQGPPGSGKTWTSGRLIARLLAEGKRVGVASTSHKAIHKLLEEVEDGRHRRSTASRRRRAGNPESVYEGPQITSDDDRDACLDSAARRAARPGSTRTGTSTARLDYLFIDEAGQVSLADALAMGTAARNLVLVGDPQQLAQVLQGSHPDGVEASVLQHLLGEHATIPPDRGLFLERTYRLHPDVVRLHLGGVLRGAAALRPDLRDAHDAARDRAFASVRSSTTAAARSRAPRPTRVAAEVDAAARGRRAPATRSWSSRRTTPRSTCCASCCPTDVRVGTVDKFQGQEARVVLYSMASSSGEDIPRGLEFLLSRNRLNVAISRAQCLAYLVCSPRLLEVNCRTIEQMRLANALCRFVELAEVR